MILRYDRVHIQQKAIIQTHDIILNQHSNYTIGAVNLENNLLTISHINEVLMYENIKMSLQSTIHVYFNTLTTLAIHLVLAC